MKFIKSQLLTSQCKNKIMQTAAWFSPLRNNYQTDKKLYGTDLNKYTGHSGFFTIAFKCVVVALAFNLKLTFYINVLMEDLLKDY